MPAPPGHLHSTYRLQLHAGFTLDDAAGAIPYLRDLGISHVYTSPYLKAGPGSTHGYDVVDHHAINPELGGRPAFEGFTAALAAHGMSHIADIVPNHVGVATNENPQWNDVLEHGPASRFAAWFDIDWRASPRPAMHDRVLLPLLGKPYGEALESGELRLAFDSGAFSIHYYERRFPVSPCTYGRILSRDIDPLLSELDPQTRKRFSALLDRIAHLPSRSTRDPEQQAFRHFQTEAIKRELSQLYGEFEPIRRHVERNVSAFNGRPGQPHSFDPLDELLLHQPYRLAYWRVAPDEINYRRFFDINDLAGLCIEREEVFAATHELILSLVAKGQLAGLRIDHPDGLSDPAEYLDRLARALASARGTGDAPANEQPDRMRSSAPDGALPLFVEKILATGERLPEDWPVAGTTGYDVLNQINGLFIDPAGLRPLTELYSRWSADRTTFDEIVYRKKLLILDKSLSSELHMLSFRLDEIAQSGRRSRDFTLSGVKQALRQIIACFPVYRSYISRRGISEIDRRHIDAAIAEAARRRPDLGPSIFEFIGRTLLSSSSPGHEPALRFAARFQQLTAPVTAKGIEDTAFYIFHRLVSLNEVGGDPERFGVSVDELHAYFTDRQLHWPLGLTPLSTHDTKRSEDVRARVNVLSEIPEAWQEAVTAWRGLNAPHRRSPAAGPDPNDEYLLYQTLVGAWPLDLTRPDQSFTARIQQYMQKAAREAKVHTSWTDPDEAYESAVRDFIAAILDPARSRQFLDDFRAFAGRVGRLGMVNSLAQTLIRLTAPGVPDTYQGTDLWDLSLVDPDNRRPVDYARRQQSLADLRRRSREDRAALVRELTAAMPDGRIKLDLVHQALAARQRDPAIFAGRYIPLPIQGRCAQHAFAFARRAEADWAITVAPRLVAKLSPDVPELPVGACWQDTALLLPDDAPRRWANLLTSQPLDAPPSPVPRLPLAQVLAGYPVALLRSV